MKDKDWRGAAGGEGGGQQPPLKITDRFPSPDVTLISRLFGSICLEVGRLPTDTSDIPSDTDTTTGPQNTFIGPFLPALFFK